MANHITIDGTPMDMLDAIHHLIGTGHTTVYADPDGPSDTYYTDPDHAMASDPSEIWEYDLMVSDEDGELVHETAGADFQYEDQIFRFSGTWHEGGNMMKTKEFNRYSYDALKAAATAPNAEQIDIDTLGAWFEAYDTAAWNGEYFDVDGLRLFPVQVCVDEECGDYETIGYEFR